MPSLSIPVDEDQQSPGLSDDCEQVGADGVCAVAHRTAPAPRRPDFELTAENVAQVVAVCRQLDGIPLAIELAASRLRSISIDDLSARLDQQYGLLSDRSRRRTPRHQTLTALLDWSYELLPAAEQRLLARLAVFAGGFDLNAAEQICATDDPQRFEIADQLSALVDKSLVQVDGRPGAFRFGCLRPIREYADTKLAALGAHEACARLQTAHRDHYLALAKTVIDLQKLRRRGPISIGSTPSWTICVPQSATRGVTPTLCPDCGSSRRWRGYRRDRGHLAESLQALEAHLDRPESARPTRIRGKALRFAAMAASIAGSFKQAVAFATEALGIGRALEDSELTAQALHGLGDSITSRRLGRVIASAHRSARVVHKSLTIRHPLTAGILLTRGVTLRQRGVDAGPCSRHAAVSPFREHHGAAAALSGIGGLGTNKTATFPAPAPASKKRSTFSARSRSRAESWPSRPAWHAWLTGSATTPAPERSPSTRPSVPTPSA